MISTALERSLTNAQSLQSPKPAQPRLVDLQSADQPKNLNPQPLGQRATDLSRQSEKFATAWQKISPQLIVSLTPYQQDELAEHLDSLVQDDSAKKYLCWGPGTDPAIMMAYYAAEKAAGMGIEDVGIKANQFLGSGKWGRVASDSIFHGAQGKPVTITWSIVPDGTQVASRFGGTSASNFRSWMTSIYGGNAQGIASQQPWFAIVRSAINAMGADCGINFIYEPNDDGVTMSNTVSGSGRLGSRGDIRIGANTIDGSGDPGSGRSILAFAYAPDYGDIVFDSADPFFNNTSDNSIRFHNVMGHEVGHAIGLAHVCPVNQTKLMEPTVNSVFRGPQFDETYSLQRQYGDPWERLGSSTNNDFPAVASLLNLVDDENRLIRWVSIDGANDQDYYRFNAQSFQKLNIVLNPISPSYLEGAQLSTGCTAGTIFDPSRQQNLGLEILAADGTTVIASSTDAPIGQGERILGHEFETGGLHYIRITGDDQDSAQLYSLTILLGGAPPSPRVVFGSNDLIAESGSVKNGSPDPGETMSFNLSLVNLGTKISSNLKLSLTIPEGMSASASEFTFDDPEPGTSSTQNVHFMFTGNCGQSYQIPGIISDDSGEQSRFNLRYQIGTLEETDPYREDFDASAALPEGWTTSSTGSNAQLWRTVSDRSWSTPFSVFTPGVEGVSASTLTSPPIPLGAANNVLKFVHYYDFERGWDGAVLEASLSDGEWFDMPSHPDVIAEVGGYLDGSIFSLSGNPLKGRSAWTGTNGGLTLAEFALPDQWGNQIIRLRWVSGHDRNEAKTGWYLDRLALERELGICEPHRPLVTLTTLGATSFQEGNINTSSELTLSIELPISEDLIIPLHTTGSAEASDLSGNLTITIPAGQTSAQVTLSAASDELSEGPETITISLPDDAEKFAAAENSEQTFTITEGSNFDTWSSENLPDGATPTEDSDSDGWSNLGEYILGTDPTAPNSKRTLKINILPDLLEIPFPETPERSDGTFTIETSSDLNTWFPANFIRLPDSLRIPRNDSQRYLRFTFSLNE
ncbi:MAG: matrixin family metalloprotease [Akkermansiaceae bacterium]